MLSSPELAQFYNSLDFNTKAKIEYYLAHNGTNEGIIFAYEAVLALKEGIADEDFIMQLLDNSLNTGLIFDIDLSLKSPANIDISEIKDESDDAERILNCVFDKLKNSSNFKNLYNAVFNTNDRINLKIEVADLPNNKGGETQGNYTTLNGQINSITNTIRISRNRLNTTSTLYMANIVIHEMIHAYLNVQRANMGIDIYNLNYDTLGDFLVGNQPITVNGATVDTHTFMFQNMIPVFTTIYNQVLNELVNQDELDYIIGSDISNPETNEFYESWNVSNFLYYLSTQGLNRNHDGTVDNPAYLQEIGNFPEKVIKRNKYLTDGRDLFTKKCN
ncbi:hypothetical protein FLAVO9AF_700001 [Flavobacterium sp. 9AF]|nr:hypothetical protein FLAVO9AF_700001 [Flavobacterium sp. 9AF]